MNNFKKKLRIRIKLMALIMVAVAIVYLGLLFFHGQLATLPHLTKGIHFGLFIGVELCLAFLLGHDLKVIRNEALLKSRYIKENDERTGLILQKAGALGMSTTMGGLAIASIISGFFSPLVFYTLTIVMFSVTGLFYFLWAFYANKF